MTIANFLSPIIWQYFILVSLRTNFIALGYNILTFNKNQHKIKDLIHNIEAIYWLKALNAHNVSYLFLCFLNLIFEAKMEGLGIVGFVFP